MSSGRAHRGGILAGYNLTAEGDGLSVRSLQSTRMNQTIEVASVRMGHSRPGRADGRSSRVRRALKAEASTVLAERP